MNLNTSKTIIGKIDKLNMKNLKDFIDMANESSLLDDFDALMDKADKGFNDTYFEKICGDFPINKPGHDAYGRKLEVGDWVSFIDTGAPKSQLKQLLGMVVKITPKRITVKREDYTSSVEPSNVFKITNQKEFITSVY